MSVDLDRPSASVENASTTTPQARRALASGTLGSALEWFDFAVYGAMSATVFPVLFFNSLDPATGLLASFATFGVGFLARPLGGVVFGYLGDKVGRRNILLVTFLMMGIASLLIGVLPAYDQIGLWAPMLLVALRFVQGVALGGETTGAQLVVMEHAPSSKRAFYGCMIMMGSPISQVLANVSLLVLSTTLSEEAFLSWGWRVPFLLSIVLVIVGIYIRLKVEETPIFQATTEEDESVNPLSVLRTHGLTIARTILAFSPVTLTFYLVTVFGISYMKTHGLDTSQVFAIVVISNLLAIGAILWGGKVADRIGRRKTLLASHVALFASAVVFFTIVNLGSFFLDLVIVTIAACAAQFGNAAQAPLFAEAFPTRVRYSGSALALTGVNLIFAAPTPFLAQWLMAGNGGESAITVMWALVIVAAFINLYFMRENRSLEGQKQSFR